MLGWAGLEEWRERKSGLCCRCDGQTLDWISKDWGWGSASGAEIQPSSLNVESKKDRKMIHEYYNDNNDRQKRKRSLEKFISRKSK